MQKKWSIGAAFLLIVFLVGGRTCRRLPDTKAGWQMNECGCQLWTNAKTMTSFVNPSITCCNRRSPPNWSLYDDCLFQCPALFVAKVRFCIEMFSHLIKDHTVPKSLFLNDLRPYYRHHHLPPFIESTPNTDGSFIVIKIFIWSSPIVCSITNKSHIASLLLLFIYLHNSLRILYSTVVDGVASSSTIVASKSRIVFHNVQFVCLFGYWLYCCCCWLPICWRV